MDEFSFRRMTVHDAAMIVRWMAADHAQPWFADEPRSVEDALAHYRGEFEGGSRTRMWVAILDGKAVGWLQDYPVAAYDDLAVRVQDPDAVAFDYLLGASDLLGRGLGVAMVRQFCTHVLVGDYVQAPRFVATPDVRNHRSIRVLERCGFRQGVWIQPEAAPYAEVVCTAERSVFEPHRKDGGSG